MGIDSIYMLVKEKSIIQMKRGINKNVSSLTSASVL